MDALQGRPVRVRLAHATAGRARFRLAERLDRSALSALADRAAASPGVRRVIARPNTGSVIVEAAGRGDAIAASLEQSGVVSLVPPGKPPPLDQVTKLGLLRADMALKQRTEGMLDLHTALAMLLVLGAVVQLFRGQLAGPASTLLVSALSLVEQARRST